MLNNYTSWSIEIRFGAGFAMIEGTLMEEVFQWFAGRFEDRGCAAARLVRNPTSSTDLGGTKHGR